MKKLVYVGMIVLGTLSLSSCGGETKTENAVENGTDAAGDAMDATVDTTSTMMDTTSTTMDTTRQ
ncbi:MAG: hypothetical protein H7Z75_06640 [Ferruginibacter sp.]|nr:hypothetical protein [Cytophagales bacterium]